MPTYNVPLGVFKRFVRGAVAVIIAGLGVEYGGSACYLVIAPVLLAVDKWIREKLKS